MPNWDDFYYTYTDGTSTSAWVSSPTAAQMQQQHEEWVREYERQDRMIEQQMQEDALRDAERAEDRRKFPLFFWRDTCVPILDLKRKKVI